MRQLTRNWFWIHRINQKQLSVTKQIASTIRGTTVQLQTVDIISYQIKDFRQIQSPFLQTFIA